ERRRLVAAATAVQSALAGARKAYDSAAPALRNAIGPEEALRADLEARRAQLEAHWATRIWNAVKPVLAYALWLTFLVLVTPPALKAFWFFVVAPIAARLRPQRIGTTSAATAAWAEGRREDSRAPGSAVSWRVRLQAGEEMLLRPEYLQSSLADAESGSQLLLSPAIPLGSIATGLVGLTRIRAGTATDVTVAATSSLVEEVGVIEVPPHGSLLFRPRNLIGIIQPVGAPIRIDRIWCLRRLSPWLTLRLRHLIFHGPCALIVKGARGVAIEPAASGRRISDSAIMGWSGGLEHRIDRSEAFLAFLTGKQSLFHDRFDGAGVVIYEELPNGGTRPSLFGRGLEGLGDAMLKVVGL
ncbi:MAG: hypothetical protein ABIR60_08305, partial [Allosphingosinicella sp.]